MNTNTLILIATILFILATACTLAGCVCMILSIYYEIKGEKKNMTNLQWCNDYHQNYISYKDNELYIACDILRGVLYVAF